MYRPPFRTLAEIGILFSLLGCQERTYPVRTQPTFDGLPDEEDAGGGGGGADGKADAGDVGPAVDLAPPVDRQPTFDACIPTGVEICNDRDDDCNGTVDDVDPVKLANDPLACGSCNIVCTAPPNTIATCELGKCVYKCQPDAVDVDHGAANGCECLITGKTDTCDGRDNDCNGVVDDGFVLDTDISNCGACNRRCAFPFAAASCAAGKCVMGACLPGYYDRDSDPGNGCESACQVSNGGLEICDGTDNDCDGQIDNGAANPNIMCKSMGVCAGTTPVCTDLGGGVKGWDCKYGGDHEDVESMAFGCDGKDNDCDGKVDEAFDVGKTCTVGVGACTNTGALECNPADRTKTRCSASPKTAGVETCNGLDDDCDGKVDELISTTDRTSDDKLVYLAAPDVTMFAYEATRFDATSGSAGADSTRRPCSVPGRLPWANLTKEEARDTCKLIGANWRLCTKDEWLAACRGGGNTDYPYGATYAPAKCNGYDYIDRAAMPNATTVATGAAGMCVSDTSGAANDELYDMSGNVREWVFSTSAQNTYEMRGGAYNVASFNGDAPGLMCTGSIPAPSPAVRLPSVGFRCCLPGKLP